MRKTKLHALNAGDIYALATGRSMPISTQFEGANFFTGLEHGINWQTYMSDDEPTFDQEPGLDQLAYDQWIIDQTDAGLIGDCKAAW